MRYLLSAGILLFQLLVYAQDIPSPVLNLQKGDKFLIEKDIHTVSEQNVSNQVQIIKKSDHFTYEYEITDIRNDSIYHIKIKHLKYRTTIQVQEEISIFDTDSAGDESDLIQKVYKKLLNRNIYAKMTERGEVLYIDSLDRLYEDIRSIHGSDKDISQYLELLNYDNMVKLFSLIDYPKRAINQKEIWKKKGSISNGILNLFDYTYFIDDVEEDFYGINKNSLISSDKNKAVPMNNIYLFYNLTGEMTGRVKLDRNSFMLKESVETQRSEGTVSMKYNIKSEPTLIWPIIIENKITLKTTKIN